MKKMMITNPDGTKMNVDLVRYFKFRNNCYLIYTIGEFDEKNYQKLYLMKVLEELGVPVIQNIKDETEWKGMKKIVKKVIKELKSKKMIQTKDLDYSLIDGIKVSNPRFFKLDQKLVNILSSNYFESELSTSNNEMIDQSVDVNQDQIDDVVPNIDVVPIENQETVSENIIPEIMPIENNETNQVKLESPIGNQIPDQIDNVVPNIDVAPIENQENLNQTSQIEIKNEEKTIDYKELYLTLKKENDSVNETMETILNELIKYKEKYGELE